jgi:tRNA threonylcarbamoyladenosine biosynthesis protein TsaB
MILALETSSNLCAVCVLDAATGVALADISNDIGRGHAERLMDDAAEALRLARISYSELTAIACGVGPGSFTGIRVGVAAARGFALALKIPARGVTSLQSIALQAMRLAAGRGILVVHDAGREELHAQRFDQAAIPLSAPQALSFPQLLEQLPEAAVIVCGSGAHLLHGRGGIEVSQTSLIPSAVSVALASLDLSKTVAPSPLYLRGPDAKPQAGFAVARESA